MKKSLLFSLFATALTLTSCIGEEPQNMECDIEEVSLNLDDPKTLFYGESYAVKSALVTPPSLSYAQKSIVFTAKYGATVGQIPVSFKLTKGAAISLLEEETAEDGTVTVTETPFANGTLVDFSGERVATFRVQSEDKAWERIYTLQVVVEKEPSQLPEIFFDYEDARLDPDNNKRFYVWPVEDDVILWSGIMGDADNNGWSIWRNGNPGYRMAKSSSPAEGYPTVPVFGDNGPSAPGNACVKMETKDTGGFGQMVGLFMAAGSFFTGQFDVVNALSNARKATLFGNPFKHKPLTFEFDAKFQLSDKPFKNDDMSVIPGIIDEPDAYVVVYKNHDETGKSVTLDGNTVLSSPLIVGKARLPHNYNADGSDQIGDTPIHGVTEEWKHFTLPVAYTEELDPELLASNGYSMIIGFASSWQGAYFRGAIGTTFWIDNVRVTFETEDE